MIKNFVSIEKGGFLHSWKSLLFSWSNIYILTLLLFFVFIVEVERKLHASPEIVLDVNVDGLLIGRCGGIVEAEHLAVERIAVVGQEHRAVVHAERTFAVWLKIACSVFRRFPRARFSFARASFRGWTDMPAEYPPRCRRKRADRLLSRWKGKALILKYWYF